MRISVYAAVALGALSLAACSKPTQDQVSADAKDAAAWNLKCWYRALMGRELDAALADCNKSIELAPSAGYAYDSRGLVYLKLKQYDKAIADYNAALKAAGYVDGGPVGAPLANNLYGRGISRLRNGDPLGGAGDMAAAKAVKPEVADDYKEYGI